MECYGAGVKRFNRLQSRHEKQIRILERAIAANCVSLRTRRREYQERVEFCRRPHARKFATALRRAVWRMRELDGRRAHEASLPSGCDKVARLLVAWLGEEGVPMQAGM